MSRFPNPFEQPRSLHSIPSRIPWYLHLLPYLVQRQFIGTKKFIIFSHPRSGSNFLRDALVSHPDAFEFGEVFHNNSLVSIYPARVLGKDQLAIEDIDLLMKKLAFETQAEAIGFSLFSQAKGHLLDNRTATMLAARCDIHTIFLVRRNLLKAYISLQRALQTGYWHVDASGQLVHWEHTIPVPDAGKKIIDLIDVAKAREWIEETQTFLQSIEEAVAATGKVTHKLYYEDMCLGGKERSLAEVNRLLKFLGLKPMKHFEPKYGQTGGRDFYDAIPNRDELIRELGFDLD